VLRNIVLISVILALSHDVRSSPNVGARTVKIRAIAGSRASIGTGFITDDPRFAQDKATYVLLTALHILFPDGIPATSVEIISHGGESHIVDTHGFVAWPRQDLAAMPISNQMYWSLGLSSLSIATRKALVNKNAQLFSDMDTLGGPIHGDATVHALVDSIEVATRSKSAAFHGLERSTRILLYQMPTRKGMSGAPIMLSDTGVVVGIHVQGVPESDKFHSLGFGINLAWMEPPRAISFSELHKGSRTAMSPFLTQTDLEYLAAEILEYLPAEILRRFAKIDNYVFFDSEFKDKKKAISAYFFLYSTIPIPAHIGPFSDSWHVGLLLEKQFRISGAKESRTESTPTGLSFGPSIVMGYARERRDLENGTRIDHGTSLRIALPLSWYSLNLDKMRAISVGVSPYFGGVSLGDPLVDRPDDEIFREFGGLLSLRYISPTARLALAFHIAIGARDKHLRSTLLSGHEVGAEIGIGVSPLW
jgi:hypothetical protein